MPGPDGCHAVVINRVARVLLINGGGGGDLADPPPPPRPNHPPAQNQKKNLSEKKGNFENRAKNVRPI